MQELAAVPTDVRQAALVHLAVEEAGAMNGRMAFAEVDHQFPEAEQLAVFFQQWPVEPTDFVVLAIGVVVALLGAPDFVARETMGMPWASSRMAAKLRICRLAKGLDGRVVGVAFDAAIPAEIVVDAVAVLLAVGLIVFCVVGDQIVEREAVVAGDEVDAVDTAGARWSGRVGAAAMRVATAPAMPGSPLTKLRMSSRKRPFHSAQRSRENSRSGTGRPHPKPRR